VLPHVVKRDGRREQVAGDDLVERLRREIDEIAPHRAGEGGEQRRARDLCEKVLSYASPLLLYAEEIDPRSGRHMGNFPQAFTHLALINAVSHVIADEQRADGGPTAVFTEMGGVREDA